MSTPIVRRFDSADALVEGAAGALADQIVRDIEARGGCRLALAGGSSPRRVYERLAQRDLASRIDWTRTHVFWGDERSVPPDHDASNFRMADRALLGHVPIPRGNVHRIEGEREPIEAARLYTNVLGRDPLDIVILGMGDDGHTASLFVDTPNLETTTELVVATRAPVPPRERISLTLRALNAARVVCFWVAGVSKAGRVAEVFRQIERHDRTLPAARVQPRDGQVCWFLDAAAAAHVNDGPEHISKETRDGQ